MRSACVVAFQVCLVGMGCSYYDPSLLAPLASDAGTTSDTGPSGCRHAFPPDKPDVTSGGDLDVVVAVHSMSFGSVWDAAARPVGWDIDKVCTCQGENDSCLEPAWATANHCDSAEGRDNGFGSLILEASKYAADFGEDSWNKRLLEGDWSLMFRIRKYNGQPDDDQVELAWYIPESYFYIVEQQDGGRPRPKFDGTDEWPIRDLCVANSDINQPLYVDNKAYVASGMLVGMLPHGVIDTGGWISMVLTDAYLTGRLVQANGSWSLEEGNIAAVWTLEDMFSQVGYMTVSGIPMCADKGNPVYQAVKGLICSHADIFRSRGTPTTPCDSLSIGIGFEARSARLGPLVPSGKRETLCDEAHNPAHDSCDQ